MRKLLYVTGVAILFAGSTRAGAQTIELGASVGWYQPLSGLSSGDVLSTDLPQRARELRGVAWGGEVRLPLRGAMSLEGVVATAASTTPGCLCPGGPLPPTGQRVNLVSVEGLYTIAIRGSNELSVGLGPAMIEHTGEGYGRYGSPKSWGGAGSVELAHSLTSHFEVAARALGAAYSFHLDFPPQSGRQLDLFVSISGRWRFGAVNTRVDK